MSRKIFLNINAYRSILCLHGINHCTIPTHMIICVLLTLLRRLRLTNFTHAFTHTHSLIYILIYKQLQKYRKYVEIYISSYNKIQNQDLMPQANSLNILWALTYYNFYTHLFLYLPSSYSYFTCNLRIFSSTSQTTSCLTPLQIYVPKKREISLYSLGEDPELKRSTTILIWNL